ncbi:MAG TPA: carbon-nitrogen hydrolase family protein [Acidimicrobiales bacterium]|nr:carbon-nitrogen hydrolase family protein [Acidimicrobiales bacterium]
MRVAAVQCTASDDRSRNLAGAGELVEAAAGSGAELVVLPELFALYGDAATLRAGAEPLDGPTTRWAAALAARLGIWLVAGSFVEAVGPGRNRNTSVLVGPDGTVGARYRKIHLFDVDVPGAMTRESDAVTPGEAIVSTSLSLDDGGLLPIGLTICYDLRFPELFRVLALAGALVIVVPSAFAAATGAPHWEILLRARAIENQVFVIAADQVGTLSSSFAAHGHSMIVDPWGTVLAELPDGVGHIVADLDLAGQQEIRSLLPSWVHRRPGAYEGLDGTGSP